MLSKIKKPRFKLGIITLLCLTLGACGDPNQRELQNYVDNLKNIESRKQKKLPPITFVMPKPIIYQKGTLRSPFQNMVDVPKSNTEANANPLIISPISMLRFVGTLSEKNTSVAYVMAPDNRIYPVKIGDRMGDQNGKVSAIYADRMEVTEYEKAPGKPPIAHTTKLQLKEEKDEK